MSEDNTGRVLIVLGMHRSGTSALTGSLEAGGVFLGDTNHASPDNKKGNRESNHIMALHNDLLERNGGSWDKPVQNLRWDQVHRALRDSIIARYSDKPLWGFKDPRTLFALKGWLNCLSSAQLIGIFRHPYLVAESLNARDGIDYEAGLELWLKYNRVLVWNLENQTPFPLIEFSQSSEEFVQQLNLLIERFSLAKQAGTFFDASLRHSAPPDLDSVPGASQAMHLYQKLVENKIDVLGIDS